MLAEIPVEEYLATVDRCAEDVLWEASFDRPPVDAFTLAERLGLEVASDDGLPVRARYARLTSERRPSGMETIVVAPDDRRERRHFAVAHELGESCADRVYDALGVDPREASASSREEVANAMAGRLLAPRRWLTGLWRDLDGDLFELKRSFATASHELIARRLLECVAAPLVVTVTDHGRVAWRRWNGPGPAPPRLGLEIDCQQYAFDTGQPAWGDGADEIDTSNGVPVERVRSWPLHEPGWRREITFTELVAAEPDWD